MIQHVGAMTLEAEEQTKVQSCNQAAVILDGGRRKRNSIRILQLYAENLGRP
jgi:hypothetical protein